MSYFYLSPFCPLALSGALSPPTANQRGKSFITSLMNPIVRERAPTDAIGTIRLSLTGVKDGSEVAVFGPGGQVLGNIEHASGIPSFVLPRYAAGSPNNVVRIMVLALQYEVVDFDYTLAGTEATIPVFQRLDRSYRNPA